MVLTACATVAKVAVTDVFVSLTRVMTDKAGGTVIRQSGRLRMARSAGDCCLITSEGRFGALHIGATGTDCTIWQTAAGTP
ncbi:hypothetical protein [Streptomyces yangpuensis]|uniref:hypothetical protein n=1 Tax=Streptomyces yangpuensis TaxID=1648182 RepID=UPI003811C4AF